MTPFTSQGLNFGPINLTQAPWLFSGICQPNFKFLFNTVPPQTHTNASKPRNKSQDKVKRSLSFWGPPSQSPTQSMHDPALIFSSVSLSHRLYTYFGWDAEDQSQEPKDASSHHQLTQLHLHAQQGSSLFSVLHSKTMFSWAVQPPAAIQYKPEDCRATPTAHLNCQKLLGSLTPEMIWRWLFWVPTPCWEDQAQG